MGAIAKEIQRERLKEINKENKVLACNKNSVFLV